MRKLAFLFPGQGAQYVGMGKDFYSSFTIAKEVFDEANDVLHLNLSNIVFNGPQDMLNQTLYSQLGIFVNSVAIMKVIEKEVSLMPFLCAGLSLGEYTALFAAGYITFQDALLLIKKRASFMTEACKQNKGTMAAILGLDDKQVETIIATIEDVYCANYNTSEQIVISGSPAAVEDATLKLKKEGAKAVCLKVEGAFHSPFMLSAQERLAEEINKVNFKNSNIPLIMNCTAEVDSFPDIKPNLINQLTSSVRWYQSIKKMELMSVDVFLEIGCGKSLSSMNKKIGVKGEMVSLEKIEDLEKLKDLI
jgi:[acyl-carrier-protein] S-malonyltransferase